MIRRLARRFDIKDRSSFDFSQRAALARRTARFFFGFGRAGLSGIISALGLFACHGRLLLVSVLREISVSKLFPSGPPRCDHLHGALGHLARSYALPRMSQRFPNTALLAFGLGGQVLLSMVIIAGFTFLGPSGKLLLLVFYPPLFSLLAGFVIRPALRLLLVETRPEVHATLVSLRSAIARAGRGLLHLSEPGTACLPNRLDHGAQHRRERHQLGHLDVQVPHRRGIQ